MAAPPTLALHVTVHIHPTHIPAFLDAFNTVVKRCLAEPECTLFQVYRDPDPENVGVFRWVEHWAGDKEWFMTHQITKSYYEPYHEITKPMWVKPREVVFLERMVDLGGIKEGN